jgi:CRAL/TRIO domain
MCSQAAGPARQPQLRITSRTRTSTSPSHTSSRRCHRHHRRRSDLRGFGMEHAGPTARELASRIMTVSCANYPDLMDSCYIVNAPWIFFAVFKGIKPLLSAHTVAKVSTDNAVLFNKGYRASAQRAHHRQGQYRQSCIV